MKSLLVINPNTTAAMTNAVVAQLRSLAPQTHVRGATATFGEPVIASRGAFATGALAAVQTWRRAYAGEDAVLLACFGDPGLAALRELCPVPVGGMLEAAVAQAQRLQRPFRIVTAGAAWNTMLREGVAALGAQSQLAGIDVLAGTGLSAAGDPQGTLLALQSCVDRAVRDGHVLILGGAGFAGFKPGLRRAQSVIDGLEAALLSLSLQ